MDREALKKDKNEIFRAAHDASAATDFLLALERGKEVRAGDQVTHVDRLENSAQAYQRAR